VASSENEQCVKKSSAADGIEKIAQLPKRPAEHHRASIGGLGVVEGVQAFSSRTAVSVVNARGACGRPCLLVIGCFVHR
jgi:hypothetical protein